MIDEKVPGFTGWLETAAGPVAKISGQLVFHDRLGGWKARWGIGRMSYLVPPGLYAIGAPDADSPVVVTANYKMSYDLVRSVMQGGHFWLLVLETFGINVWCAAGKGTFGTGELVRRVAATGLEQIVGHRRLLLPIMGAAGVKAVEVKKRTGFEVLFATLRIADLPAFIDSGFAAEPEMRELTFSLHERLVLTPMELVGAMKSLLYLGGPLALSAGFQYGHFNAVRSVTALLLYLAAILCGTVLTPMLLPWLPGRMFSLKGGLVGLAGVIALSAALQGHFAGNSVDFLALVLLMVTISAFYAMNFTGSTPFTSPSGVRREMRRAMPLMVFGLAAGTALLVAGRFLS